MNEITNIKLPWYSKKWVIILLHIAVWLLMFSLPFLLRTTYDSKPHKPEPPHYGWVYLYAATAIIWIAFFYFNAYILIPKLIYKKKYWMYFGSQLLFLVIMLAADRFFLLGFFGGRQPKGLQFLGLYFLPHLSVPVYSDKQHSLPVYRGQDAPRQTDQRPRKRKP